MTDTFECPDCGGWAEIEGAKITRDCSPECSLSETAFAIAYEEDETTRAERNFESSLSGDWGPLSMMEQVRKAWEQKKELDR
jgi:hypothetical protein